MRVLLSRNSKKKLFRYLKEKTNSRNIHEISEKLSIPKSTLDNWFYDKKTSLPKYIIPRELLEILEIIDEKPDNWGKIKGGKKTYQILISKYGTKEIKRRQIKGGKKSALKRDQKLKEEFFINIENPLFLEFYGALLGDGYIVTLKGAN